MTLETFLIWIAIGLVAGWLASAVAGGGFGLIGDIVVGIVGAFIGGTVHVYVEIDVGANRCGVMPGEAAVPIAQAAEAAKGLRFRGLHVHVPWGGIPGTIFVAFVGALVLLVILRVIRSATSRVP